MRHLILFFEAPKKASSQPVHEMVLFFKAEVKGHFRRLASGKIITVRPYLNKRGKKPDKDAEAWKQVEDLAQTSAMPKIHPDVLRSGDAAQIQAAEALLKALTVPEWGMKKFQAGKMTRKLELGLLPYKSIPEVQRVLDAIKNKQPLDSRLIHYVKRRFLEHEPMNVPSDLDQWFEKVLSDPTAKVMMPDPNPDSRYLVYSDQHHLLAVVERNGQRVSAHDHDGLGLGGVWCLLKNLLL